MGDSAHAARSNLWGCLLGAFLLGACGSSVTITLPASLGGGAARSPLPDGFALLYSPAPWAFRTSIEGEPVRRGARSERFELREGDCGGSDCGNFRARAQIVETEASTPARLNRDIWYGWSFLNGSIGSVTPETYLGTVVGEWKLGGEQPALFRLLHVPAPQADLTGCEPALCSLPGDPTGDVVLELAEMADAYGWGDRQNDGRICRLWNMEANRGRWIDLVVNTNFGTDGYGYLRVWVNGELRCNYLGALVSPERARTQVVGPTHRRGLFQSFTRRWAENQGAAPKPTAVVYYDEFRSGLSRKDVDPRWLDGLGAAAID